MPHGLHPQCHFQSYTHELDPALLASGDSARGGMVRLYCGVCLCLCMLDQPLKKYLLSVYIIPCGAR